MDGLQIPLSGKKSQGNWPWDYSRTLWPLLRLPFTFSQSMDISHSAGRKTVNVFLLRYSDVLDYSCPYYTKRVHDPRLLRRSKVLEKAPKITYFAKTKVLCCRRIRTKKDAATLSCNSIKLPNERHTSHLEYGRCSLWLR